jgi:arsenite oxidase small subunit
VPFSRRNFLSASAAIAAAGAAGCAPTESTAQAPSIGIAKAAQFVVGTPIAFSYPDPQSPALAVRLSKAAPHGVGPGSDIVAYSRLCVHKGCPVGYNAHQESFVCPCHYSAYDAEQDGQLIIGHATTSLPRILLSYDTHSDLVTATGVDGLIYGRINFRTCFART